jgi:3-oxoacyl-[acyl-carrier-protein] synthase III
MIFGDGAAAVVIGPAPVGAKPDIEVLQMYASGPVSEVNSIIWPNPEFDNNITVFGPEVKALAQRYLKQMIGELSELPGPDGKGKLLDAVDLGNASSASIPLAIRDAVRDGVIARPMRIFAPGFGAGAVGGYAVLRIDPGIVALDPTPGAEAAVPAVAGRVASTSSEDVRKAFGD